MESLTTLNSPCKKMVTAVYRNWVFGNGLHRTFFYPMKQFEGVFQIAIDCYLVGAGDKLDGFGKESILE